MTPVAGIQKDTQLEIKRYGLLTTNAHCPGLKSKLSIEIECSLVVNKSEKIGTVDMSKLTSQTDEIIIRIRHDFVGSSAL